MLGYGFINDQTQFQFHKGTIRTKIFDLLILCVRYFNSIKVRLELLFLQEKTLCNYISIP